MTLLGRLNRVQIASLAGCLTGGLVYFGVLFDLRWSPGRVAHPLGYASNFFDIQAKALMSGRLDVPADSLGIEGFVMGERTYMYFPPFPALLRIPVFLITEEFSGRLTLLSMAAAWIVFAIVATRLVWLVARLTHGTRQPTWLESTGAAVLIAAITGGTVLTFDAALPWVYHEVYAWAIAAVVGALYWLVRAIEESSWRNVLWLTGFAVAAAWTRTTGGLAVVGAITLAIILSAITSRDAESSGAFAVARRRLSLAAALPLAASVTLNLVKFGHLYMFPLENQVWTQLSERRRQALEVNGGTITGPQFIEPTTLAYFGVDGLRFTEYFPWISLPANPPALDGVAFFDQTYRTASVTATTPLLLLLLALSLPLLLRRPALWRFLVPPLAGSVAVGLPVLMYGYVAYRYTSEFVPALVFGGVVGFWLLTPHLLLGHRWFSRAIVVGMAALTAYSLVIQAVLGLTMSAVTQGGEQLQRYVRWQERASGGPNSPQARLTTQSDVLPDRAAADTIAILGDCRAAYLATGDRYEPWTLVDAEPVTIELTLDRDIRPGLVKIATITATSPRDVLVEVRDDHHVRVLVRDRYATVYGNWFGVYPRTSFRIGIELRSGLDLATVTSTPGGHVAHVPALVRDENWTTLPGEIHLAAGGGRPFVGLTFREIESRSSLLCRSLLHNAQLSQPANAHAP